MVSARLAAPTSTETTTTTTTRRKRRPFKSPLGFVYSQGGEQKRGYCSCAITEGRFCGAACVDRAEWALGCLDGGVEKKSSTSDPASCWKVLRHTICRHSFRQIPKVHVIVNGDS